MPLGEPGTLVHQKVHAAPMARQPAPCLAGAVGSGLFAAVAANTLVLGWGQFGATGQLCNASK